MYRFVDMHCHLDFLENPACFAQAAGERGLAFFNVTVTPAGFEKAREALFACDNVRVGVGLHPWWIHDGRCGRREVERVSELVADARFVGEVGLDFGKRCNPSREEQLQAFRAVAAACAKAGGRLLSVHAVKSAHAVLDVLENSGALDDNQVVFHWFSDSGDALARAVRAGCLFSVNPRMMETRRGRAYVSQIPANRLLLETDLPPENEPAFALDAWERALHTVHEGVAQLRGPAVAEAIAARSEQLLGLYMA